MTAAIGTQQTAYEVDIDGTPTWTEVLEVKDFGELAQEVEEIPATHLKSTAQEYIGGLSDGQEIPMTCNYIKNDAGQEFLRDNLGAVHPFRVTLSNGDTAEFDVLIKKYGTGGQSVNSVQDAVFTLKVSGAITRTEV